MELFATDRLSVREFTSIDIDYFIELLSDPEIRRPVPQPTWSEDKINSMFEEFCDYEKDPLTKERSAWGVFESSKTELIGLCALLTNDDGQRELGYRFRHKYWGKGYGTEVTKNFIDYCFSSLQLEVIAADVNIENIGSVKILEKFFSPVNQFFNERDQCYDRRYVLNKSDWQLYYK
ncbi:MAG: GNAT family N-acetyltransferase [Crocinitomicaceae bacterium]|nr:GNAT family N-acetyltransferase [Crocinitomicaceae bacterium]